MEQKIVDARGLACPLPVVNAKKALSEFKENGILTVLADNEIAVQNLKKFAVQKGLESWGKKTGDREYEVTIQVCCGESSDFRKWGSAGAGGTEEKKDFVQPEEPCSPDQREKGLVVVLPANVMGEGDERLGRMLMKAFVFALTKEDILQETVVCYNSGAYLTCEGSDVLEDFKEMEAEGVKIVTCGTCLDFYGLKEKLAVGTVTNMYEIVEIMEHAESVVRP